MKFGQKLRELRIAKWSKYYVDYIELKYILKSHLEKDDDSDEEVDEGKETRVTFAEAKDEDEVKSSKRSGMKKYGKEQPHRDLPKMSEAFFTMLEDEVNLVEALYKKVLFSLQAQLTRAKLMYHNSNELSSLQYAKTKAMSALAHHINHDINMLLSFVELNKVAVKKITKKYAKITKQPVKDRVVEEVEKARTFMKAEQLYHLREEAERFFNKVSKSAYRNAFTAVV
mmetsp:Transcript_4006/g.5762  ORF Transcript_4006/g.5762 Transcript_4006/m.5762 type:complete len:227 (+) Transcript_4006:153-833(+)|eukprot:CAMPEP_0184480710 /NCGR_PEP_ID=MMETSP0113_2-20130426/2222_1 /TAXON_ID=91329 /ORGANISM="Norrisiella sphaerica, Strain BC52" /LENGTH=226 /DNA_ID=CAMNT_0026859371 /DNA_START=124 /DNA_END=804 /DNA_ORIENTATION=-